MSNKKILFAGGGTGGSVTPLLAIVEDLILNYNFKISNFLWLGTKKGIEQEMTAKLKLPYRAIRNGKLRRYWSWRNFSDLALITYAFLESFYIIFRFKPDMVMSAGGFVGVPVIWAAWIMRVPVIIHQQDARPGLANKLAAPFARAISVTFEASLKDYGKKAVWTGNPVRRSLAASGQEREDSSFRLDEDMPVLLILGGGTGAQAINNLVEKSVRELNKFCQVIHLTGKGKRVPIFSDESGPRYHQYEFLDYNKMAEAYRKADVVISRCGMSVLTELAYLGKPSILIPIPDSHQEDNAEIFYKAKAAIVFDQNELTTERLIEQVKLLIANQSLNSKISLNISKINKPEASKEIIKIIKSILYD